MASIETTATSELVVPPAVHAERVEEDAQMRQPPPGLPAAIIRNVKARFGQANDFIVEFENHTHMFTFVLLLHNRRALGWKECQALADIIKSATCGNPIDAALFGLKCTELEKKYGAINGPLLLEGRSICVISPGPGDVNNTSGDIIAHLSLSFDSDGDLVVIADTYSHNKYKVVLSLPTNDQRLFSRDCQALVDILFHLETGDRVDNVHFLYVIAMLRRDHNYVRLFENMPFSVGAIVVASSVRNVNPLPQSLADAVATKQSMADSTIQNQTMLVSHGAAQQQPILKTSNATQQHSTPVNGMQQQPLQATSANVTLPVCPYRGIRYVRALVASGQAQVYEAVRPNGERVAVKVFSGGDTTAGRTYRTELRMLLKMREHRNVIGVLDFFETPQPALVMRFVSGAGDLSEYLTKHGRMAEPLAVRIAAELAAGVAHLHSSGVVHRDLKSANVLLRTDTAGNLSPVIIDLGLGSILRKPEMSTGTLSSAADNSTGNLSEATGSVKGSLYWMAPEMVMHQHWSEKSDVYAFAVILWEMLCACRPYAHIPSTGPIDLLLKVAQGARPDMREVAHASPALRSLIERCWNADPRMRPTIMQVVDQLRGNDPVAIFKSIDRDGDAALDFGEFVQFLQRFAPLVPPGDMAVCFAAIDEDSSSTITLPEFLKFWNIVQRKGLVTALTLCQSTRTMESIKGELLN